MRTLLYGRLFNEFYAKDCNRKGRSVVKLKAERVLTAANRYFQRDGVAITGLETTRPYDWSSRSVATILDNEVYLGHTVSLKGTTLSYKNKKRVARPEGDRHRFENTNEPLIDKETWGAVQSVRGTDLRAPAALH